MGTLLIVRLAVHALSTLIVFFSGKSTVSAIRSPQKICVLTLKCQVMRMSAVGVVRILRRILTVMIQWNIL